MPFFVAMLQHVLHILQIFFDQIQFDIILVTSSIIIIAMILTAVATAAARTEARAKARAQVTGMAAVMAVAMGAVRCE
jgi:hypothetical protein